MDKNQKPLSIYNFINKNCVKNLEISCEKEIRNAINMSIKDFKATLFIENIDISEIQEGFEINKIELKI